MTTPRADSTLAERVKKLEQELRRIKLSPSLSQSAVEPLAVKGSGWFDSTSGNEPKVFDGQNWVPVRDETIAVAQTTADTAQTTAVTAQATADAASASALALQGELDTLNDVTLPALQTELDGILPITETDIADDAITTPKIAANAVTAAEIAANTITANEMAADSITANEIAADAIDGKTITGAWTRTAASGPRISLNDPAYPGEIVLYTGSANETAPARIKAIVSGLGTESYLQLIGPTTVGAGAPTTVDLGGLGDDGTTFQVDADAQHVFATDLTLDGFASLRLGDGTDYITIAGQAVTDADLSDPSNVFPFRIATGTVLVTGVAANTMKTQVVNFPVGRFTATPTVVVSPASIANEIMTATATSISTSGFTVGFRRTTAVDTNVTWIAIQAA